MTEAIQIRYATHHDAALLRLAALDDRRPPAGPVLLAMVGDEPRAAISTRDGSAVADPFYPSARLIAALRGYVRDACERGGILGRLSARRRATRAGPRERARRSATA